MRRREYDVIVVGGGGSGLAAAYSATENGGHVLVLEKLSQLGGTTGIAVGSFAAACSAHQRDAGVTDEVASHLEDAGKFAPPEIESRNNDALRSYFLSEAAATLDWLQRLGVSFIGPNPEPPNRVPRMHNVVPGAKAYIAALQMALQRAGSEILCNATVERLLLDDDRRVSGVQTKIDGASREFYARHGVILAAGDYANNHSTIAAYKGRQFKEIEGINPHATGDGHVLAQQVGADLINMDVTYGPELRFIASAKKPFQQWLPVGGLFSRPMATIARRLPKWIMRSILKRLLVTWQHPENSLFDDGAILINQHGQRFVNEKQWPDRELGVASQPGKIAYILLDGRLVKRYSKWPHFISTAPDIAYAYVADYQRLRPDVTVVKESLGQSASVRNLDEASLKRSIAEFNESVANKKTDQFGRSGDENPLDEGPWALLGPLKAYFTTTEGGVAINEQLQALDESGNIIPGLYAVGQNGLGGMILWGHGLHIAWAMTSGRLAGELVMR